MTTSEESEEIDVSFAQIDELTDRLDDIPTERLEQLRDDVVDRLEGLRREHLVPALDQAREAAPRYAEMVAEKGREAYEHAREHAPEYAEKVAEKGREAYEHARDVAPEYVERAGAAAERVERYLEDHVGEETLETWRPRVLAGLAGFVIGVLVGWLVGRRSDDDELLADSVGIAYPPATRDARPSTHMPRPPGERRVEPADERRVELADEPTIEAGADGSHTRA